MSLTHAARVWLSLKVREARGANLGADAHAFVQQFNPANGLKYLAQKFIAQDHGSYAASRWPGFMRKNAFRRHNTPRAVVKPGGDGTPACRRLLARQVPFAGWTKHERAVAHQMHTGPHALDWCRHFEGRNRTPPKWARGLSVVRWGAFR